MLFVFSFHADLVADLISPTVMKARDLVFQNQSTVTTKNTVFILFWLSNGLVYLCGRRDRLYVNRPNTLLLTEKQTGGKRDKWVNKKDRASVGKE